MADRKIFARYAARRLPSLLWRAFRALYYWPTKWVAHAIRLSSHGADRWYRIKAPWIINLSYPQIDPAKRGSRPASWHQFRHHFTFDCEQARFNIDYAIKAGEVRGLALMFAMGAGDYFFSTPIINALRKRYPDMPILAFATRNAGSVNSPLVGELLGGNPDVNDVRYFDGRQTRRFENYDYSDAMRQAPANYLAIPVFCEHSPTTRHRVISLFETFGLEPPPIAPPPLIHLPPTPAPHIVHLLERIKQQGAQHGLKGVAFLQVDARSSNYTYPYADDLALGLCDRGYFVLSASKLARAPAMSHELDFKEFALMDSIYLLKLLRENFTNMQIVSVASVFWSVSAAFGIPNLGMQHFTDDAMHAYWYPNITVITHRDYPRLSPAARFLARSGDYALDANGKAVFGPGFVLDCFDRALRGSRSPL
jgi:hypothetical protein